jgi:cytoskeletal protein RodZ
MLNSPGIILKNARNQLGYTVDEVHNVTKIKKEYIRGLENDDVSAFPAELYYKNFLKTYALYLKLNPDELVQMYEQARIDRQEKLLEQDEDIENKFVCFYKSNKKLLIYGFCVIVVCLIMIVNLINKAELINKKIQEHKILQEQSMNKEKVSVSTLTNVVSEQTESIQQTDTMQQPQAIPQTETIQQQETRQQTETVQQTEQPKQRLYIKALANTWIKIVADNRNVFDGTITKYFECKADNDFTIKIGNVDTVKVYFNGTLVDITSGTVSKNKVRTIKLSKK